jgi:hypothetical protein
MLGREGMQKVPDKEGDRCDGEDLVKEQRPGDGPKPGLSGRAPNYPAEQIPSSPRLLHLGQTDDVAFAVLKPSAFAHLAHFDHPVDRLQTGEVVLLKYHAAFP